MGRLYWHQHVVMEHTLTQSSGLTPLTVTVQDIGSNSIIATLSRGFALDYMLTGTCQW